VADRCLALAGQPRTALVLHARLLEADLNIKRGIQDEETSLELLVADLAGLR